jgi:hypothetical protein
MDVVFAAILGVAGAGLREAFELGDILRHRRGDWPEEWRGGAFIVAEGLRILAGGVFAGGLAGFDQVGQAGAFVVGAIAPSIVQYLLDPFRRHAR